MDNRLEGKVAFVTGASRGLGRCIAGALVRAGARVGLVARPSPALDETVAALGAAVTPLPCDLTRVAEVNAAVQTLVQRFGRLDFLINNAAIGLPKLLEDNTEEEILRQVGTNLLGPIWCTRAAIPHLRSSRGTVVFVSSEAAHHPFPRIHLYNATKAAVEALARGMKWDYKADGIRIVTLRSGSMSGSSFSQGWEPKEGEAFYQQMVATGHLNYTGKAIDPNITAEVIVNALCVPPEAVLDLIEVRSNC
ncbi:MAG: SDR family oxidoreductase [Gammaproteobacteria bacterium]